MPASVLHRVTKQLMKSPSGTAGFFAANNWIVEPNLAAVTGVPNKY